MSKNDTTPSDAQALSQQLASEATTPDADPSAGAPSPSPESAPTPVASPADSSPTEPGSATNPALSDTPEAAGDQATVPDSQGDTTAPAVRERFKPISPEKLRRARRTKRILIGVIVVLLLALLSMAALAAYVYVNQLQNSPKPIEQDDLLANDVGDGKPLQDTGTAQEKPMPALAQLFGKTPNQALTLLGTGYSLTKTEAVEDEESA